jgi:hypothetical protein
MRSSPSNGRLLLSNSLAVSAHALPAPRRHRSDCDAQKGLSRAMGARRSRAVIDDVCEERLEEELTRGQPFDVRMGMP